MDDSASLKQTVTHLFDAVRYSQHAKELEESVTETESKLESELNKLESQMEEIINLLDSFGDGASPPLRDLSQQISEFLTTAKEQAKEKLKRMMGEDLSELRNAASGERDKATKSLETYLASDPLPVIENVVSIRLEDGVYTAQARYEVEGDIKYDFGLAAQNSRLFHEELQLSRLGYELKVPVRFSKTLLKNRVPGFERLDQYSLVNAETSSGKVRANFQRVGNEAKIKVVASSLEEQGFVGIEYSDRAAAVNVMNDPSLSTYVDIESIKKAMGELAKELSDLAQRKVALLRLALDGDRPIESVDCYGILQTVLGVLGPTYKSVLGKLPEGSPSDKGKNGLSVGFVKERLKVLGDLSRPVSQSVGIRSIS